MKINHTSTPAFAYASAWECHAGLTESSAATHDISRLRIRAKLLLKFGVIVVWQAGNRLGESLGFHENHMTMSYVFKLFLFAGSFRSP
jgi:hypothetical protein